MIQIPQILKLSAYRVAIAFGLMLLAGISTLHAGQMKQFVITVDATQGDLISQSQQTAMDSGSASSPEIKYKVSLVEEFRSAEKWFQAFRASSMSDLDAYLGSLKITPENIEESLVVVTPELGGGPAAEAPREGHKVYMIPRALPGIGLSSIDELKEVSKGSQGIIESIGDGIEWDHSYATEKGTYCVYRAEDPALILEHAKTAQIPADPIEVEHLVRNFDF